jgi:Acetyl/propionyl-CoA carboxylase, alpha subunit
MQEIIIPIEGLALPAITWEDSWEGSYKNQRFFILGGNPEAGFIDLLIGGKRVRVRWYLFVEGYLARVTLPRRISSNELELRAPMPGLIREVRLKVGDKVSAGTPALVIEAMKMENLLFVAGEGVVEAVCVSPGTAVEKGALLLRLAPAPDAN